LNDIMGATTWSIPQDSLTTNEVMDYVDAYISASHKVYGMYLDKVRGFKNSKLPHIGNKWPSEGYFLPDADNFVKKLELTYAATTLNELLGK